MIKVVFVCLGNICRSPMAEFMFSDLLTKRGVSEMFDVSSAATSDEAEGCGVHRGTVRQMELYNIKWWQRSAVQLKKSDYNKFDFFIGMDESNVRAMKRLFAGDPDKNVYKLLDFSDNPRDIADPWYAGNFDDTYNDIAQGLPPFLDYLLLKQSIFYRRDQ